MTQNNTPESPATQTSVGPVDDQFLQELLKTDPSEVDAKLRANGIDESVWADVKRGISLLRQADESILDATNGPTREKNASLAAHSIVPRGNALRVLRGGAVSLFSILLLVVVMGKTWQSRWGVVEGIFLLAIAAWGVLDFIGSFDDKETPSSITKLSDLAAPIAMLIASVGVFTGGIAGGHANVILPQLGWGIVTTLGFIAMAASVFQIGWRMGIVGVDESGVLRPLLKRHGFWVIAVGAGLYFPLMGAFSLWDPWETHYGEVAREILARDDWISLWWAQDGWFFSKPILNFWMQATSMGIFGAGYQPGMMLPRANGVLAHPEWIVRAPNVLLTITALYFIYKGVAKVFGRRAGFLGAFVLATMPDWYFLAHQTMADMPCISSMTAAMGLLLLGLHSDPDARVKVYELRITEKLQFRLSAFHVVFGAILMCAIPQIVYLFTRNLELVWGPDGKGFRPHLDVFSSGSGGGNCTLPGNEACRVVSSAAVPKGLPSNPQTWTFLQSVKRFVFAFEPALQGLLWSGVLGVLLWLNWGERRTQRLFFHAAWLFAAIGTMGKGPAGFGLPIICATAYLGTKKRFSDLLRIEAVSGLLIILAVAIPWFVAMYVRHGSPFTDRLIFHDMYNRAFGHVHDTNEGDDTSIRFYIWQLGYALFPWTALAPLGLIYWLRRSDSADKGRGDVSVFLAMWFVFSFGLFSFMGTKFHHYIFPAVPPIAILVGIALSSLMPKVNFLGTDIGAAYLPPAENLEDDVTKAKESDEEFERRKKYERMIVGGSILSGALLLGVVGRDVISKPDGEQTGAIRFLQLFTYQYKRPWPEELDYSKFLAVIVIGGVLCLLAMTIPSLRRWGTVGFLFVAAASAIWGKDIYMVKTAPHWGQRELLEAYYQKRANPDEPVVAYQMNWKGENFYAGNKIPAFVSTGPTYTTWVKEQKAKGIKQIFVVTEHSRVGGVKSETGASSYEEITDKKINNKFVVVKAVL